MEKNIKKPWAAAILNFFLPGLGYMYSGKRVGFGIGLIILSVIILASIATIEIHPIILFDSIAMSFLFAYDGYKTAEEVNKEKYTEN